MAIHVEVGKYAIRLIDACIVEALATACIVVIVVDAVATALAAHTIIIAPEILSIAHCLVLYFLRSVPAVRRCLHLTKLNRNDVLLQIVCISQNA